MGNNRNTFVWFLQQRLPQRPTANASQKTQEGVGSAAAPQAPSAPTSHLYKQPASSALPLHGKRFFPASLLLTAIEGSLVIFLFFR